MTFSEIANLLYPYCGQGQKNAGFVVTLIDNVMEDPGDRDEDGNYNPLTGLVPRTLENYFNGSRPIGQKNASKILGHLDKERFAAYVDTLSTDALSAIAEALKQRGIPTSALSVSVKCADLLQEALLQCSQASISVAKIAVTVVAPTTTDLSMEAAEELAPDMTAVKGRFAPLKTITPPHEVAEQEIPYVTELMAAYSEAEGVDSFTKDTLKQHEDKYGEHFKRQRKDFYAAESVRQGTREAYGETDPDQFEVLKEETYDGVVDVWEQDHRNGFVRLTKVLTQAAQIRIDRCWLCRDTDWIGNSQKKGVCHILVNDGKIKGWVKKDD
ncbi:hypothetical protein B1778_01170 [Dehalococcoides mccartyi]|uniref:ABC-three component system protein n=1 Tax=Dehalococcoides mccartyi TaxID=61435 RepID=UPI00098EFD2A|nr:ABC-three component system protein [Dehalococcoides mccartyi]AQU05378.1 hypothetical protein B1777_01315 [Dehalococcoides mccartyi]AQU06831.1 hypothetical protein B1778_01170 [Dehalococcoides mccartyi]